MSDFNSAEFVVGSAKGLRVWRADSLGRLTGWTHRQIWTPGENVATCRKADRASSRYMFDTEEEPPKPCSEVTPSCGCGFWAYHSGTPDFGSTEGVVGICEGYGLTTVGTKGFRASKARILALAFPKTSCGCGHTLPFAQSAQVEALVRRNYAEVPTFDSLDAMLTEFPPDKPAVPDPSHPDFWTMADPATVSEGSISWAPGGVTSRAYAKAMQQMLATPPSLHSFAGPSEPKTRWWLR